MAEEPRILVVDDDRLMLTLLVGVLRHEGFHLVDKAGSGEEALEKCQATPPDIIFMDVEMPGMSGIKAAQALKEQGVHAQIVLVSATPKTQYVLAVKEQQLAGFLVKPASPKAISDTIARCLKNARPGGVGVGA